MMDMLSREDIMRVSVPLLQEQGVCLAYLFGSRARGTSLTATSDYDFAVLFKSGTPQERFSKRLHLIEQLQQRLHTPHVDVVVLDDTRSATLRYSVLSEGVLMYAAHDEARIDFEFSALHEYQEFAPFLRAYNEAYMALV